MTIVDYTRVWLSLTILRDITIVDLHMRLTIGDDTPGYAYRWLTHVSDYLWRYFGIWLSLTYTCVLLSVTILRDLTIVDLHMCLTIWTILRDVTLVDLHVSYYLWRYFGLWLSLTYTCVLLSVTIHWAMTIVDLHMCLTICDNTLGYDYRWLTHVSYYRWRYSGIWLSLTYTCVLLSVTILRDITIVDYTSVWLSLTILRDMTTGDYTRVWLSLTILRAMTIVDLHMCVTIGDDNPGYYCRWLTHLSYYLWPYFGIWLSLTYTCVLLSVTILGDITIVDYTRVLLSVTILRGMSLGGVQWGMTIGDVWWCLIFGDEH